MMRFIVAATLLVAVLTREYSWPLIQDSNFLQRSSTSIGIRGRVTPLWYVDEARNYTYFVYGSFVVKYDMENSTVQQWISIPKVVRGCVLNQWRHHVLLGVQTDAHLILYKYQKNSLLEEPDIITIEAPGIGSMFGKLILDSDGLHVLFSTSYFHFLTVTVLTPVQVGTGATILRINMETMKLAGPRLTVDKNTPLAHTAFYYIGQKENSFFLGGRGRDDLEGIDKSIIITVDKENMKVLKSEQIGLGKLFF